MPWKPREDGANGPDLRPFRGDSGSGRVRRLGACPADQDVSGGSWLELELELELELGLGLGLGPGPGRPARHLVVFPKRPDSSAVEPLRRLAMFPPGPYEASPGPSRAGEAPCAGRRALPDPDPPNTPRAGRL